jgi:long-chain-acyl-CoA dehydrogenase
MALTGVTRSMSTAIDTARPETQQADSLIQIGTRRIFEHEHDQYRELCRRFYEDEVIPFHDKWEEDQMVPRELWKKAGEMGLLCVTVPEEYGGMGLDVLYSAVMWEEQSYANTSGPGWFLHSEIVAPYIVHYGTEEQKQHYLPAMVAGEKIGAIAMTEPGAGSDLAGMRTTAIKDPATGDYILNGSKTYITNGYMSDIVIVCAKTDPEAGAKGVSLFLVDAGIAGFTKGKPLKKLGMKAQDTSELFFEDCRIPASALLGEEGKGFAYLMTELPQERLLVAEMSLASAEAAFEWTREFLKDRIAFGKPLTDKQTIQHRLAEMKTELTVARTFADRCLELLRDGRLDNSTASMAKYWCTDLGSKICDECLQLHGGAGYMWEYKVAKAYADVRVARIYGGSNEIMKELIARPIIKK